MYMRLYMYIKTKNWVFCDKISRSKCEMSRNRISGQFGNSDTKNVKEHKERRTFMAADRAQSSSTSCPVRMVTMPAVSSSPLLWDTVSCRQLSTILYRCLKTRRIRAEQSDNEEVSLSEGRLGWSEAHQASMSCRFSLSLSKVRPDSFWQRMYLQTGYVEEGHY